MISHLAPWVLPSKHNRQRPMLLQSHGLLFVTLLVGFWYLVLFAALRVPQLRHILGYGSSISVAQVLTQTNSQRQAANLPTLKLKEELNQAALDKAQDMFANQYWAHVSPGGEQPWDFISAKQYHYQVAGENLAKNFDNTTTMVSAWMDSPTHRSNILNPNYQETGIAVLQGELNGSTTTLVVQLFAKPDTNWAESINQADKSWLNWNKQTATASPDQDSSSAQLLGAMTKGPLFNPHNLFRYGIMAILAIMLVVLISDLWRSKHKKLTVESRQNLAHLIIVIALMITLAAIESGSLI